MAPSHSVRSVPIMDPHCLPELFTRLELQRVDAPARPRTTPRSAGRHGTRKAEPRFMDLFGRFRKLDSSLQRGLDNGFARVFGGEVVPAEIDELLKQEVEDALMEDRSGALHAPVTFEVHVAARDYENLLSRRPDLDQELRDRLHRFIRNEGWATSAPVTVDLIRDDGMHTGQLKCRSSFTAAARRQSPERQAPGAAEEQASDHPGSRPEHVPEQAPEQRPEPGRNFGATPTADPGYAPGHAEWPGSTPDSGRSPVAKSYDAEDAPADADHAGGTTGTSGTGTSGSSAVAGAAGSLAGLAHPQGRAAGWGQPSADPAPGTGSGQHTEDRPESRPSTGSTPETEVVAGPAADPVNGIDGTSTTGSGGYQAAPQRTVTLYLQDGSNRTYVLTQGSNSIGRGNQVDFRLPDTGVSRRHCDITWDGFDAVLTDLRSTNGTTVNDIPVENWLLADGDLISLGHSSIEVRFS